MTFKSSSLYSWEGPLCCMDGGCTAGQEEKKPKAALESRASFISLPAACGSALSEELPRSNPSTCDLPPQPVPRSEGCSLLSLDALGHAHLVWSFIGCSLWGKTKAGFPPLFYGCICHIADVAPFLASLIIEGLTVLPSPPSPCLISCTKREPRWQTEHMRAAWISVLLRCLLG